MEEKNKKLMTVCFVLRDNQVLLGMKKVRWGAGHWNGFGGKVEVSPETGKPIETFEASAIRELKEESGLETTIVQEKGVMIFHNAKDNWVAEVHVFTTDQFVGEPVESDEMTPRWFNISELPLDQMWRADREWVPRVFDQNKENKFEGEFFYDENDELVNFEIKETEGEALIEPGRRIPLK